MKKIILLLCLFSFADHAQTAFPNIDYEMGSFANWNLKDGIRGFTNTYSLSSISNCTTNVSSTTGCGNYIADTVSFKTFNGISVIPPNNPGRYILEQNSSQSSGGVTVAEYSFVVSAATSSISVRRLIFLNASNETTGSESFSEISLLDMNSNIISGSQEIYSYNTYSASALTTTVSSMKYLPWTNYSRNLSAYIGQTVTLQIMSSQCSAGGHTQYSFFDGYNSNLVTGINSDEKNKQLNIIPNPASEVISITNAENKEMKISIYDLQGREVIRESNKNIDISALEKGMYIIKAFSETNAYSRTFIKN